MNKLIPEVTQVKFPAASPDVAIFVKVAFQCLVDRRHQCKYSEIKFALMYQQWIIYIFLYDMRAVEATTPAQLPYLPHFRGHIDANTPIGVFAWLHNPSVKRNAILFLDLSNLFVLVVLVLRLILVVPVFLVFTFLLEVLADFSLLLGGYVFDLLFCLIVNCFKLSELLIIWVFD